MPEEAERSAAAGGNPPRFRAVAGVLLAALLLAFALGPALAIHLRGRAAADRAAWERHLAAVAEGEVRSLSDWIAERRSDADFYRDCPPVAACVRSLRDGNGGGDAAGVQSILDSMLRRHGYRSILLLEPEAGRVLLAAGDPAVGPAAPDPSAVRAALRDGLGMGAVGPAEGGSLRLDFAASFGNPPVVVVLRVDPEAHLLPMVASWLVQGETTEILLVGREGESVAYYNRPRFSAEPAGRMRRPLSSSDLAAAVVLRGERGLLEGVDYRGIPVLAFLGPVPGTDWGVVAKVDLAEVEAGSRREGVLLGLATLLVILLGSLLALVLLRRSALREELRVRTEAMRRLEAEERLASVVRHANDILLLVGEDLRILDANDRALEAYGYSRVEMSALTAGSLRSPAAAGSLRSDLEGLETGDGRVYETVHRRKDGTEFPVEVSVRRIRANGHATFQAIVRDISERRRAAEELAAARAQFLQAQKMEAVGRLAGGVAHDFNNLLTVINGYSELLLGRAREGDPARAPLEEIRRAGVRAADLTRQLLSFSRRQVTQPRVLDLNAGIRDVEKMLRRLIGEDIELRVEPADDLPPVLLDPGQMEQVLMNLVVNARDAIPGVGTITIRTSAAPPESGSGVLLEVRDSGCGIPDEVRSHLFEPFFTTKGAGKGTGLGLATVHGIVHQAGGRIEVESAPGRGTAFRIRFPRAAAPGPAGGEAEDAPPGPGPAGREIVLLVEDEAQVRAIAAEALRGAGYRVHEAGNPTEALRILSRTGGLVDLLLTDVILPQMDGKALSREVRRLLPGVRVLFMSGYAGEQLANAGSFQGEEFLQKPFTSEVLRRAVRKALDARRS